MRPTLRPLVLLTALAATACGKAEERGIWGSGSGPGFCNVMRAGTAEVVSLTFGDANTASIDISAPAFGDVVPDTPQPAYSLHIDGEPVRSAAIGIGFGGGHGPGLSFPVGLRRLLSRHPNGFSTAVMKGGILVFEDRVDETARAALLEAQACDRERRFQTPAAGSPVPPPSGQ